MLEFLSARSERQREAFEQHPDGDRGLRRRVHRHADRRHRAAGRADEDADRPQDRRGAAAHLRRAARGAGEAPGARARDGGRQHAGRGGAQRADGAHRASRTRSRPAEARQGRGARRRGLRADAEADATRALRRGARPRPTGRASRRSAPAGYTAMQLATILGEHGIKLVPDIAVGGGAAGGGLAEALIARMLGGAGRRRPVSTALRRRRRGQGSTARLRWLIAGARPGALADTQPPHHGAHGPAGIVRVAASDAPEQARRPRRAAARRRQRRLQRGALERRRRPRAGRSRRSAIARAASAARLTTPAPRRRRPPAAAASRRSTRRGRSESSSSRPARLWTSASKITLRSSRMLPGHGYARSAASAAGVAPSTCAAPAPPAPRGRSAATKWRDQRGQVVDALAQRRQPDRDDRQPLVEVGAERARGASAARRSRLVAARMRKSTTCAVVLAEAADHAVLEHAQQLDLRTAAACRRPRRGTRVPPSAAVSWPS